MDITTNAKACLQKRNIYQKSTKFMIMRYVLVVCFDIYFAKQIWRNILTKQRGYDIIIWSNASDIFGM